MEWVMGSCDAYGRLYISTKIRHLAGVTGEVEYTIKEEDGVAMIVIRKARNGNKR